MSQWFKELKSLIFMHIIKTKKNQTILFDDKEIMIFNTQYITNKQRFIIAIFIIIIAIAGIIFHFKDKEIFFFISYLLLLLVWGIYFISYLIKNKDPEMLNYEELSKAEVISGNKISTLKLHLKNQDKYLKFKTKSLDSDLIKFLKSKNLISNN